MVLGSVVAVTAAAKWILAAKIAMAVGEGLVIAGPILNKTVKSKKKQKER